MKLIPNLRKFTQNQRQLEGLPQSLEILDRDNDEPKFGDEILKFLHFCVAPQHVKQFFLKAQYDSAEFGMLNL